LDRIENVETENGFAFKFVFANGVELLTPTVEITGGTGETIESVEQDFSSTRNAFKLVFNTSTGRTFTSDDIIAPVEIYQMDVISVDVISQVNNGFNLKTTIQTVINGGENSGGLFNYLVPIVSGEGIVTDVDETGKQIEIHLDTEILNNLARALKTPVSAPTSTELVAVDITGTQTMLTIGEGLGVENGALYSIRERNFHSRGALYTWLLLNWEKVLFYEISINNTNYKCEQQVEKTGNIMYFRFFRVDYTQENNVFFLGGYFSDYDTIATQGTQLSIESEGVVVTSLGSSQHIPDEGWNSLGLSVKVVFRG
ncbi:MAG: hypothetical protein J6A63_04475, partial [Clostridia bacterium]|nr:hypothetical protein [Clostridia bacterium]